MARDTYIGRTYRRYRNAARTTRADYPWGGPWGVALGVADSIERSESAQQFAAAVRGAMDRLQATWPPGQTEYPTSFVSDMWDQVSAMKQALTLAMNTSFSPSNVAMWTEIQKAGASADRQWSRFAEMITGARVYPETVYPKPTDWLKKAERENRKTVMLPDFRDATLATIRDIAGGLEQIAFLNDIVPAWWELADELGVLGYLKRAGEAVEHLNAAIVKGALTLYKPIGVLADIMKYSVYAGALYLVWTLLKKPKKKGAGDAQL